MLLTGFLACTRSATSRDDATHHGLDLLMPVWPRPFLIWDFLFADHSRFASTAKANHDSHRLVLLGSVFNRSNRIETRTRGQHKGHPISLLRREWHFKDFKGLFTAFGFWLALTNGKSILTTVGLRNEFPLSEIPWVGCVSWLNVPVPIKVTWSPWPSFPQLVFLPDLWVAQESGLGVVWAALINVLSPACGA